MIPFENIYNYESTKSNTTKSKGDRQQMINMFNDNVSDNLYSEANNDFNRAISYDEPPVPKLTGIHDFKVVGVTRDYFNGNAKTPPCPRVWLNLEVNHNGESIAISDNFPLCSEMDWKTRSYLRSVGLLRPGKTIVPDWDSMYGLTGRAEFSYGYERNGEFIGKNQVKRYIDKEGM